jgi:hypothetical protein
MKKIYDRICTAFYNLFVPEVSIDYVVKNVCNYVGLSKDEKWVYYREGNYRDGREVRVDAAVNAAYCRQNRRRFYK